MPIPFNDIGEDGSALGSAAFLKVESSSDGACSLGALLVITARGEPLEFAYNRVRIPQPFLWREADLRRYVLRAPHHLAAQRVFSAASHSPVPGR